jgi:hypothetical protein
MAKGNSGRIVIEIDPDFKHELYEALEVEGMTLKKWFLNNADEFLKNRSQLSLLLPDKNQTRKVS